MREYLRHRANLQAEFEVMQLTVLIICSRPHGGVAAARPHAKHGVLLHDHQRAEPMANAAVLLDCVGGKACDRAGIAAETSTCNDDRQQCQKRGNADQQ